LIVLDSSAAADYVLGRPSAAWVEAQLDSAEWNVHAPHLIDLEVTRAVRRFVLAREVTAEDGRARIELAAALVGTRYAHVQLLDRIWELRDNFPVSDAAFVALAEALGVPLVTTDEPLARTPGHAAQIIGFPG
jgi:predicted nucleic acid-binding protein